MTADDEARLGIALTGLAEVFNEPMTEAKIAAYVHALQDLPIEELELAAGIALRSCRFMPRPVELREIVEQAGASDPAAAWDALVLQVRRCGAYGTPDLPDETRRLVARIWGSWRTCCEHVPVVGSWEHQQLRVRFMESYRAQTVAHALVEPFVDISGFLREGER